MICRKCGSNLIVDNIKKTLGTRRYIAKCHCQECNTLHSLILYKEGRNLLYNNSPLPSSLTDPMFPV